MPPPAGERLTSPEEELEKAQLVQAGVEEDVSTMDDEQIGCILQDNNARLWYISKYGREKFDEEALRTLVDVRTKFRGDPRYQLSVEEEVAYRKATMAGAEFLGDRHPEAIRHFALVQARKQTNPLRYWLLAICAALLLALFSNGYQTLLGNEIRRMSKARADYLAQASQLTLGAGDVSATLSRMCELSLVYRTAARQLEKLNPFYTVERAASPGATRFGEATGFANLGVCEVIRSPQIGPPTEASEKADEERVAARRAVIREARAARLGTPGEQAAGLHAAMLESSLALFFLPVLYALLGALTSAVRNANQAFKSMTLTRADDISLGVRVLLGVVGGATIGILFSTDALEGTGGLTALGLAFAVGYAVDLFFNMLDAFKVGLGGATSPSMARK